MDLTKVLQSLSLTKPVITAAQQKAYQLHVMDAQETGQKPLPFARWLVVQDKNALAQPQPVAAPQPVQNQLAEPAPFRF